MNDLQKYFKDNQTNNGPMLEKPDHFLIIYDELLSKHRDKDFALLEIGIGHGSCLKMWKSYLGKNARIYGADLTEGHFSNDEQITCILAEQGKEDFVKNIINVVPKIDFVIDDGSHKCSHQIASLKGLFPYLSDGGMYVCEDTHTSYRDSYEGGYKREGTFIEYCKTLIDALHYPESKQIPAPPLIHLISSIIFYRSMAVIRKKGVINPNV